MSSQVLQESLVSSESECVLEVRIAKEEELDAIVFMQAEYNKYNLSLTDRRENGFLSLITNREQLSVLNRDLGVTVATCNGEVVGYEIPVGLKHCDNIPLFIPLREEVLKLSMDGQHLDETNTVISGQICVDRKYRSMGIGEAMHLNLTERLSSDYEFTVVEVDELNDRSMHFSQDRLCLQPLSVYRAYDADWHVLGQRLRESDFNRKFVIPKITIPRGFSLLL